MSKRQLHLHPLPGDGRFYCGPAAIASFTGLHPKEEVREAVNKVRGRAPNKGVMGMHNHEVVAALKLLGFNAEEIKIGSKPTLNQFMQDNPNFVGVVQVTKHYIAVARDRVQDSLSGAIYHLSKFDGRTKRVRAIIKVWKD